MTDIRSRDFQRILIIKPSALGDVVHGLPVLVKLRDRYPDARIDWLVTPENADLVRHHPDLSNVVLFARRDLSRFGRSWQATIGPIGLLAQLRRGNYDLVVDLHGQFRSAVFTLATGAPVRLGFDRPRGRPKTVQVEHPDLVPGHHGWTGAREGAWLAYTHWIPIPTLDVHAVDRYLWIGPILGLDDQVPDLRIHLGPEATPQVDALLQARGLGENSLAVLVPGTIWETKHWHVEGFASVGRYFKNAGFDVVLAGTSRDRNCSQAIVAACPDAHDLCGQTSVGALAALIRKAAICITNDSGAMHVAVAVNRPVVSVFGPTNPIWIGPYGRPEAVVRAGVSCSPCNLRRLRDCPHGHACMEKVTADMVIERVESVLADSCNSGRDPADR
jgi:ADP-heptose:LPS heptosyltransferase